KQKTKTKNMDYPYATTHRRLKQIQGHFMTPQSLKVLPQFNVNNSKSNLLSVWEKLNTSSRLGAISIPPLTTYYIFKLLKGTKHRFINSNNKDIENIIKEISGNDIFDKVVKLVGKVIGFLGVIQISSRMQTFLGVKLTFSRSYQLLLTLSSILETILSFTKINQK
ncbi:hypothetical protein DICPUDRAFT_41751, partial [Dictyostelium purpureum]